jgi:5-oxoprolinase (ATP-hydrolysing)
MKEVDHVVAEDFLDDGTLIKLTITIDRQTGSAVFDFTGTGAEMYGNLNAPPAVSSSAIIYCLRSIYLSIYIYIYLTLYLPIYLSIYLLLKVSLT